MANFIQCSRLFLKRNASTILTCVGSVGVVATSVMAVKATPKALKSLEAAEKQKGEKLTKLEVVKTAGPAYIPAALIGVSTIACIFGANTLNKRQQASLMSAYAVLNSSYTDYKKKVRELHGEEGEFEVRSAIVKDKYEQEDITDEDDGKQLFYDNYWGRYFRATNETVLRAEYEINKILIEDAYASINEFYDELGIDTVPGGDSVGWSSSKLFDQNRSSWIHFEHERVEMDDGMICYIITMTDPSVDFEDY
jgi:hypothetical protein